MIAVIEAALSRSRAVLTTLVLIIVFGLVSYFTIPREADPDIPIPFVHIGVFHEGISPVDSERLIVKPLETKLRAIDGLIEMKSTALENYASVTLEFDVSFDKDRALAEVREKVDQARRDLPQDSEEPVVTEFNTSLFPVIYINIYGEVTERALLRVAKNLQDSLEAIPNVLEAKILGEREELLEVIIDPSRLETYRITQGELFTAVSQNNRLVAAGALSSDKGRFSVKVPGLFETANDVMRLPIKTSGDSIVTLADVAEIKRTFKDATGYNRLNGQPGISISVSKRLGVNIVETVQSHKPTGNTGPEQQW